MTWLQSKPWENDQGRGAIAHYVDVVAMSKVHGSTSEVILP